MELCVFCTISDPKDMLSCWFLAAVIEITIRLASTTEICFLAGLAIRHLKSKPLPLQRLRGGRGERLCSHVSCSCWLAAFFNWWRTRPLFLQGHLHPLHFQSSVLSLQTQFYNDSFLDDPGPTLPSVALPLPDKVKITGSGD